MSGHTNSTTWCGARAIRLTAGGTEVVILPDRGGKLASLVDRSGHEWLAQPAGDVLPAAGYGASFVGAEMCGWDEMAPTIVSAGLPDHGEVWAVPWDEIEVTSRSVVLEVTGRSLPYRLRRRAELVDSERLRLSYRATALGSPADLLWAAHPQLRAPAGTTVELPPHIDEVIDVDTPDQPRPVRWAGGRVDVFADLAEGQAHKVWCRPEDAPAWCRLHRPDGAYLELSWDPMQVPYLGVWVDRCAWSREPVVALEPSTGFYDDLHRARRYGRVTRLAPDTWTEWHLDISITAATPAGS